MAGRTHISLLGRPAIAAPGSAGPHHPTGRRAEIVFAYLVLGRARSMSRDELAGALWPDTLPDTWNAALRSVLSDVRRLLERAGLDPAAVLLTEQGRLRLRLPEGAQVDIEAARDTLAQAAAHQEAGACARAAELAGEAADAAALPFLSFHDEGWAGEVRAELDRLHIEALGVQGRALAQLGEAKAALAAAARLVRADPFGEAGHRLRIRMLGALGDRAGAKQAFEHCRTLLETELGMAPSPETEAALATALGPAAGAEPGRQAAPGTPAAREAAARLASPARFDAGGGSVRLVAPRFGGLSVLVVEDHDFQRRTALALLRGLGVGRLRDAADGASALALLDEEADAPDVIVCDLDMPGMDGVEFIRHVAERGLASAVVIASGLHARVLDTVRAASEGYGLQVLGAVGKPLSAAGLEAMLAGYRPAPARRAAGGDPTTVAGLAAALTDATLPVVFSPVVDLGVGRIAGVHALVPPPLGVDAPAVADAAGLGRSLAEHLLRAARDACAGLDLSVSVELTPSLLTDVSLVDGLAAVLRDRVVLVAGAGALSAADSPAMLDVLARLRVKGFGLCVEGAPTPDVARLPLTLVQVPGELVAAVAGGGDPSALQAAVEAARELGVPLLGVCDSEAAYDLLLQIGCSYARGAFLAPPVPGDRLAAVAAGWTEPAAATERPA